MNSSLPALLAVAGILGIAPAFAQQAEEVEHMLGEDSDRVPVHTVVPTYPEKARRQRVEGEVEVCFNVDRDGSTKRVAVRRSTNRVFEKAARDAVRASTYQPLAPGQSYSGIKTCRTFRFRLRPVPPEDLDH